MAFTISSTITTTRNLTTNADVGVITSNGTLQRVRSDDPELWPDLGPLHRDQPDLH